MWIVFGALAAYFLVIVVLVLKTPKATKETSFEEYYTGSKSVGGLVIGLVMLMTAMAGSTWTGYVGFGLQNGSFVAYCIPYVCIAQPVFIYLLADRIWPLGKKYGLSTLGDLYELRYRSKVLKVIAGAVGALMNLTWITMEVVTLGYILNVASGGILSREVGSLLGIIFMTLYTLWGGVKGLVKVNTFQSIIMIIGCLVCLMYAVLSNYPSVAAMFNTILLQRPETITLPGPMGNGTNHMWVSYTLLCSAGVLCYPSLYLKLYMGKNVKEIRKSSLTSGISSIWMQTIVTIAGFSIIGYEIATGTVFNNIDSAYLTMFQQSGNMAILAIACVFILAAGMGTIDATMLAIAGLISNDIIMGTNRIRNHDGIIGTDSYSGSQTMGGAGDKTLRRTRIIIVVLAVASYVITLFNLPFLMWIALINYQVIGQLFVPMLGALLWKKATSTGAICSLITGIVVTAIPLAMGINPWGMLPGVPGLICTAVVYIIVGLITYKPDRPEAMFYDEMLKIQETIYE